jgi:hypothetical protein
MEMSVGLDYSDNLPDSTVIPPLEGGDIWRRRYKGILNDKYNPNDKGNKKMALKFYDELGKVIAN